MFDRDFLWRLAALVLLVSTLAPGLSVVPRTALAQEELLDGFDDDLGDFSDDFSGDVSDDPAPAATPSSSEKPSQRLPFDLSGRLGLMTTVNTAHHRPDAGRIDWRGLSALRTELRLTVEDKVLDTLSWHVSVRASHDGVYGLRRSHTWTPELTDDREAVVELDKAYVGGRINRFMDLYIGRQIVIWGKSDTLRVVDVINPLDMREPGLTDIEDLRLPVTMTRLDVFLGGWTLKTMAIHETRFDMLPVWGSDYYPSKAPLPPEHGPDSDPGNTQFAVSLGRTFNGGDLTFYYADIYNRDVHLETLSADEPPQYSLSLDHGRITMLGLDANRAFGNLMLKTELALFRDVAYINPARIAGGVLVRGPCPGYTRYDGLVGFEYLGIRDTMISADVVLRYIDDYDGLLEASPFSPKEKEEQWVLRLTRDFWHETLSVELLLSGYGWSAEGGSFERLKAVYDVSDDLTLTAGCILYQGGSDIPIDTIGDNDRIFGELVYSF
ncbi:hypothetical protein JCM14469_36190 [Desulfatiferula olefinivorans]